MKGMTRGIPEVTSVWIRYEFGTCEFLQFFRILNVNFSCFILLNSFKRLLHYESIFLIHPTMEDTEKEPFRNTIESILPSQRVENLESPRGQVPIPDRETHLVRAFHSCSYIRGASSPLRLPGLYGSPPRGIFGTTATPTLSTGYRYI